MAKSQQEAKCWEQLENDAAKHHRKALDGMIQAAEEAVEYTKMNNLLRQEVIDAENELAKAVQAKNSCYQVQKVGLNSQGGMPTPCMGLNAAESGNFWKTAGKHIQTPIEGKSDPTGNKTKTPYKR